MAVGVLSVVLLILVLVSVWVLFYQLLKQQGRILLRLDQIQGVSAASAGDERESLPVGSEFPSFSFPDLSGKEVKLEDFRGKMVLLVNWSRTCGFCLKIASDLAQIASFPANLRIVLLVDEDAKANREMAEEHGLKCPILLVKDSETPEPFKEVGTPAAYLLDAEGRVANPIAVGADQVPTLARAAAGEKIETASAGKSLPGKRALSESRIEREGLKAGTPAPSFSLPDVYGKTISLEEYRGKRVLLVFSDPHCGPCEQLSGKLAELYKEHRDNHLQILIVGRGDAEENRRKAEAHKLRFPVVLQRKWELSRQYGIFATPVAFLVDEDGVIAGDVAKGTEAILKLAQEETCLSKKGENDERGQLVR
jgi:peroxiredoxin